MKLEKRMEKELKFYFPSPKMRTPKQEAWIEGFHTGFRVCDNLAGEEAKRSQRVIIYFYLAGIGFRSPNLKRKVVKKKWLIKKPATRLSRI